MNIVQIFAITLVFATTISSVFSVTSRTPSQSLISLKDAKKQFANNSEQLKNIKTKIQTYYEAQDQNKESVYEKEVRTICQTALDKHFKTHKVTEKSAIIFDIDETVLSDYPFFKEKNFEWTADEAFLFRFKKVCTPIRPVRDFFNELKKLGYKLIFLTSRRDTLYQATTENLANTEYVYDELILLPIKLFEQHVSHGAWKFEVRKELSKKYDIIGSVGDSQSDFEGGCCGVMVKLPNYLY